MGRLIDADELRKNVKFSNGIRDGMTLYVPYVEVISQINYTPTAYDINKVVEELEEERAEILNSNDYESEIINYCLDSFDRAIEIVKAGGKNDNCR